MGDKTIDFDLMSEFNFWNEIEMPKEMIQELNKIELEPYLIELTKAGILFQMETYQDDLIKIKELLGVDPRGIKMLRLLLKKAYETGKIYNEKKIEKHIHIQTMKCFSRFVNEYRKMYGNYGFDRDFWVIRQISTTLFRIGELEYEYVKDEEELIKYLGASEGISIHIPSDARLTQELLKDSFEKAKEFFGIYYPKISHAVYFCESWLLSPVLPILLEKDSKILIFQRFFELVDVNREDLGFLEWVYNLPEKEHVDLNIQKLPEVTSLQRKMKNALLTGEKIGTGFGILI